MFTPPRVAGCLSWCSWLSHSHPVSLSILSTIAAEWSSHPVQSPTEWLVTQCSPVQARPVSLCLLQADEWRGRGKAEDSWPSTLAAGACLPESQFNGNQNDLPLGTNWRAQTAKTLIELGFCKQVCDRKKPMHQFLRPVRRLMGDERAGANRCV